MTRFGIFLDVLVGVGGIAADEGCGEGTAGDGCEGSSPREGEDGSSEDHF